MTFLDLLAHLAERVHGHTEFRVLISHTCSKLLELSLAHQLHHFAAGRQLHLLVVRLGFECGSECRNRLILLHHLVLKLRHLPLLLGLKHDHLFLHCLGDRFVDGAVRTGRREAREHNHDGHDLHRLLRAKAAGPGEKQAGIRGIKMDKHTRQRERSEAKRNWRAHRPAPSAHAAQPATSPAAPASNITPASCTTPASRHSRCSAQARASGLAGAERAKTHSRSTRTTPRNLAASRGEAEERQR